VRTEKAEISSLYLVASEMKRRRNPFYPMWRTTFCMLASGNHAAYSGWAAQRRAFTATSTIFGKLLAALAAVPFEENSAPPAILRKLSAVGGAGGGTGFSRLMASLRLKQSSAGSMAALGAAGRQRSAPSCLRSLRNITRCRAPERRIGALACAGVAWRAAWKTGIHEG